MPGDDGLGDGYRGRRRPRPSLPVQLVVPEAALAASTNAAQRGAQQQVLGILTEAAGRHGAIQAAYLQAPRQQKGRRGIFLETCPRL